MLELSSMGTTLAAVHSVPNRLAAKYFLSANEEEAALIQDSPEYQASYPQICERYAAAESWHGTGRFQHRGDEDIDVLAGIISDRELKPHLDNFDPTSGEVPNISLSPVRMYSVLYAKMHFESGTSLQNQHGRLKNWARYFLAHIPVQALRNRKEIKMTKEERKRFRENIREAGRQWRGKVTKEEVPAMDLFEHGSDIPGNYPILIGIHQDSYQVGEFAKTLAKHERRTRNPIPMSSFTHIEVPEKNVPEVKAMLEKAGIKDLPVIPMEYGEQYCREFTFTELASGKRLAHKPDDK